MLLTKMQQYWMSILKNKKIFTRNYYKCKILTVILIILMVFTGCRQERITEKVQKKETVESAMYAEAKEIAQTFQNIYIQEKSELNTLKTKRKIINCLKMQGYAAHRDDILLAGKTGTAELKATKEDTSGKEIGWFSVFTAEENVDRPILLISMVENVKGIGGSGYVVNKDATVLDEYFKE